jgi:hypothetical protein
MSVEVVVVKKLKWFALVISFGTLFSNSVAMAANYKEGDHVPLPAIDFSVKGQGASVEEFMNSLTDVNGVLNAVTLTNGGRVTFDQPKGTVVGDHISIPFTYHEVFGFHSNGGGKLSAASFTGCEAGSRGKELVFQTDPPKDDKDPVHISQCIFQVCAKTGAGGEVQVHVNSFAIAGPKWKDAALDAMKIVFSNLGTNMQAHTIAYAGEAKPATAVANLAQEHKVAASGAAEINPPNP